MGDAAGARDRVLYEKPFTAFQGKTLEQKIQEMADREEIRELISRYAHRVAQGLSVAPLFTDDGVFVVRRPGRSVVESRGRAELDENFAALNGKVGLTLPMIHNCLLEISGDEAIGLCSNELRMVENGESIIASGYYRDAFRREQGQWKFTSRDMTFFHWVPVQRGWAAGD